MNFGKGRLLIGSLFVSIIVLSMARSAVAQVIGERGIVTVGGVTYRLWGVVLPSSQGRCGDGWAANTQAVRYLENLVNGRVVECEFRGRDQDGRTMAICRADGQDLAAELARTGLAWAALGESHTYVLDEGHAMAHVLGVHAHGCRVPSQAYPYVTNRNEYRLGPSAACTAAAHPSGERSNACE
jgi:endonuclease YncB( thermonuclease family)